jgi:hypothetical protein
MGFDPKAIASGIRRRFCELGQDRTFEGISIECDKVGCVIRLVGEVHSWYHKQLIILAAQTGLRSVNGYAQIHMADPDHIVVDSVEGQERLPDIDISGVKVVSLP